MALVPLRTLIERVGISRATYHNLAKRGLLPSWSKKYGIPGKRGCHYLYDEDVFMQAWEEVKRKKNKLGFDRAEYERRLKIISKLPPIECVKRLMKRVIPLQDETMDQFEMRHRELEAEYYKLPVEELRRRIATLEFEEGDSVGD